MSCLKPTLITSLLMTIGLIYSPALYADANTYESVNGRPVPIQFASVVRLLEGDVSTPTNESPITTTCHYSVVQQKSFAKWPRKYPSLKFIPASCQTATIDKLRTSESISQLIGPINNPYGVRDDILDYIVKNVPSDNPKLLQATIQNAYFDNLAFYSQTDSDKLKFERKGGLSLHCMYMFSDKSPTNISRMIGGKMRDSKNRAQYVANLEQTVFAWQTLGSGYGANTEDDMCKTGAYLK